MNEEWWIKNDKVWMKSDEGWWFKAVEGFCFQTDRRTNGQTFAIVESLSRLKTCISGNMCDIQSFLTMTQEHLNLDAFILRKPSAKQQQSMIKFMVDLLILSTFISLSYECLPNLFNRPNTFPISPSSPVCVGCPIPGMKIINHVNAHKSFGL